MERKDRENAHNIKEDEIRKVRIEMEKFKEQCQEKIRSVKQSQESELQSYKEHVRMAIYIYIYIDIATWLNIYCW